MIHYENIKAPATRRAMQNYVEKGWQPGGFLTSLLSNKLVEAVSSADHINITQIPQLCEFLVWELPAGCWGSPEKVRDWIACGGLEGLCKEDPAVS